MFPQTEWVPAGTNGRRKTVGYGANMTIVQFEFEVGGGVPPHSHPHEQIGYIISGKMEYTVDGKTFVLTAGESTVVLGGIVHSGRALENSVIIEAFSPLREEYRK